jgi:hypothetical protein
MKMKRRINWTYYLIIGISASILVISGCGKKTEDHSVIADLLFENKTEHVINYAGLFELTAGSSYSQTIVGVDGKGYNSANCCQGGLESFQGAYNQVYLIIADSLCLFYDENEGPTLIANYEVTNIGEHHYLYTYTFSEQELSGAELCD